MSESKSPARMPAEFGLATATFVIIASMVGVGVLTTSGFTVYFVGSNQMMLALWVLGGIVAACGALTLCELSASLPHSGGDYVYLHAAYGPLIAFLSGWVSFLIGFGAPSASAAIGSANYLTVPLALEPSQALFVQRVIASVLILIFAIIHTSGRKQTAHVQGWITGLKLLLLTLFMVVGLVAGRENLAHLADRPPIDFNLLKSMMFSLVFISYAYIGWNSASYLAEEFVEPQKVLPKAILLGTLGVMALYLGLNLVYALALSVGDVKAIVDDPANTVGPSVVAPIAEISARKLFGSGWSNPLSVAFGLMLLSSLSAYLLTGPRVIYAMAVAGQFPAVAGRLTKRSGTPGVAMALQTSVTLVFVWIGTLAELVNYATVGLSILSMLAVGAVYVLRWRQPNLQRPFRTPGYPFTPAFYLLMTGLLTAAAFSEKPLNSTLSLLSILVGVPIFYVWRWFAGVKPATSASSDWPANP